MNIQLGGEKYELRGDRENWSLRSLRSGKSVLLDRDDYMTVVTQGSVNDRTLELWGLPVDPDSELSQTVAGVRENYDEDQLAVLLDTTGVRNAVAALQLGLLGPVQLLDVALLTHAVVLYDVVLIQPMAPFFDNAPDVFVPMQFSPAAVYNDLWALCAGEEQRRRRAEAKLANDWKEFLGRTAPLRIDLGAYDQYQNSPAHWDGIPASHYMDLLIRDLPSEQALLEEFLSIQTLRTFFNDRLAGILNVPYLATALRAPVMNEVIRPREDARPAVDQLFAQIADLSGSGRFDERGPYRRRVSAPPLFSFVLQRMEDLSVYWQVVGDLRVEFEGWRAAVRKDRAALTGHSSEFLNRYSKHLEEAASHLAGVSRKLSLEDVAAEGGATGMAAVVVPAAAPPSLLKIAAKLVLTLGAAKLEQAFARLFRPDVYVVANVAQEARHLKELGPVIQRLWGKAWDRSNCETLERLAAAQPSGFLQVGRPE